MTVEVLAGIVIFLMAVGGFLVLRRSSTTGAATDDAIGQISRRTTLTLAGPPIDVFQIDADRLTRIYEQTLGEIPPLKFERETINGRKGHLQAEMHGVGGGTEGEATTTIREERRVIEDRPGVLAQTLEAYLDSRRQIQRVDFTGDRPLEQLLAEITQKAESIGLRVPDVVSNQLRAAWQDQGQGLRGARFDAPNLTGYVSIKAEFEVIEAPSTTGPLSLRAVAPTTGAEPALIVLVTASGKVFESAISQLTAGAKVEATSVGRVTGREQTGELNVSAIYSYWSA